MLEQVSLQALVDIANHPTLSHRLSEVVISLHVFPPDPDIDSFHGQKMYEAGYVSHNALLATGQALRMLTDAFSKLVNLHTISLRDYNARGRHRDGESASWRSWGWTFGLDFDPSNQSPYRNLRTISPEPVLPLLFYALGCAQVKPRHLHVFLRKEPKLNPSSFNMLDGFMGDKIRPILKNMEELMLAIALDAPFPFGPFGMSSRSTPADKSTDAPLKRLLHSTPNLKTLRLNFDAHQFLGHRFLTWLGKPSPASVSTSLSPKAPIYPISLPHLSTLELGMLNVSASVLLEVLTKFDLESFSLWKCILHSPSLQNEENCWSKFLHDLAAALPQASRLKSVLIGYPSLMHVNSGFGKEDPIFFKPSDADDDTYRKEDLVQEIRHRAGPGTDIKEWFEALSKRAIMKSLDEYYNDSESITELGDEDEDDDDHEDEEDDEDDEMDDDD